MATSSFNRNPKGKNQHNRSEDDDKTLLSALATYHREKITNNGVIAKRLFAEHGIHMSASTVKRRRKEMNFRW